MPPKKTKLSKLTTKTKTQKTSKKSIKNASEQLSKVIKNPKQDIHSALKIILNFMNTNNDDNLYSVIANKHNKKIKKSSDVKKIMKNGKPVGYTYNVERSLPDGSFYSSKSGYMIKLTSPTSSKQIKGGKKQAKDTTSDDTTSEDSTNEDTTSDDTTNETSTDDTSEDTTEDSEMNDIDDELEDSDPFN